jgi:hypothetical protein
MERLNMEQWKHRVITALDALLTAQLAESSLRSQLDALAGGTPHGAADLKRLWHETRQQAAAARMRVDDVLWTGSLDERHSPSSRL